MRGYLKYRKERSQLLHLNSNSKKKLFKYSGQSYVQLKTRFLLRGIHHTLRDPYNQNDEESRFSIKHMDVLSPKYEIVFSTLYFPITSSVCILTESNNLLWTPDLLLEYVIMLT